MSVVGNNSGGEVTCEALDLANGRVWARVLKVLVLSGFLLVPFPHCLTSVCASLATRTLLHVPSVTPHTRGPFLLEEQQ